MFPPHIIGDPGPLADVILNASVEHCPYSDCVSEAVTSADKVSGLAIVKVLKSYLIRQILLLQGQTVYVHPESNEVVED